MVRKRLVGVVEVLVESRAGSADGATEEGHQEGALQEGALDTQSGLPAQNSMHDNSSHDLEDESTGLPSGSEAARVPSVDAGTAAETPSTPDKELIEARADPVVYNDRFKDIFHPEPLSHAEESVSQHDKAPTDAALSTSSVSSAVDHDPTDVAIGLNEVSCYDGSQRLHFETCANYRFNTFRRVSTPSHL